MDLRTAPLLDDELRRLRHSGSSVIIDLDEVEFMDCAGLRVLLGASGNPDRGVLVTPGSPQVQKLFAIAGVTDQLRFVSRVEITRALDRGPRTRSVARGIIASAVR